MISNRNKVLSESGFNLDANFHLSLTGSALRLFKLWESFLIQLLLPYADNIDYPSLLLEHELLQKSHYLHNFPHHLFVSSPIGSRKSNKFIAPAACLHLYTSLEGQTLTNKFSRIVVARCARFESGKWSYPFRLPTFTMLELVSIFDKESVDREARIIQNLVTKCLNNLGFPEVFVLSDDSFYLGEKANRGAQVMQKLIKAKYEFNFHSGFDSSVSLASLNKHYDFFGKNFSISVREKPTNSYCIAFGLERLTVAGILLWGSDTRDWPKELLTHGHISQPNS